MTEIELTEGPESDIVDRLGQNPGLPYGIGIANRTFRAGWLEAVEIDGIPVLNVWRGAKSGSPDLRMVGLTAEDAAKTNLIKHLIYGLAGEHGEIT